MTPKQAAIAYWGNDNPPQELIAAMAEVQRPLLEVVECMAKFDGRNNNSALKQMARSAIAATKGE